MKDKDLRASIAHLYALRARSDIEPEQRRLVELAIAQLRKLQRKQDLTKSEVYRCVRVVTEALVKAFLQS